MKDVELCWARYLPYRAGSDHDHCSFCWRKFAAEGGDFAEGYRTPDAYHWVCPDCYRDFAPSFAWRVVPCEAAGHSRTAGSTLGQPVSDHANALPAKVADLEARSLEGTASLGEAFEILRREWVDGSRGRERALHLMFLAWFLLVEPSHLTGLSDSVSVGDLQSAFSEAHDFLLPAGDSSNDAKALYVAGLMMKLNASLLGSQRDWADLSNRYRQQYRTLQPTGLRPAVFEGRGAFGHYFKGQAAVEGGY